MHRTPRPPTVAAATVALLWPVLSAAQPTPVTGAEIQASWAGKEIVGNSIRGARFFMRLEADGRASISVGNLNDTGTWRPHDKGYCATWQTIRAGQERCFTVVKAGWNFNVIDPDGSIGGVVTSVR